MANYLRWYEAGGIYFFTFVTEQRARLFNDPQSVSLLRESIKRCREGYAFEILAGVALPDHIHLLMQLPKGESDFSIRMRFIKSNFTRAYLTQGGVEQVRSMAKIASNERGVWQSRFWEHLIRDEEDLERHFEYIHFNPVKHGLVDCPHDWQHSSFHQWVQRGDLKRDWMCACHGPVKLPNFDWAVPEME